MGCISPAQLQQGQPGWSSLLCSHVLLPLPLPQVCRWHDCRISLCSPRSQQWTNLSPQKVNFLLSQFSFLLYLVSLCWLDLLGGRNSCSSLNCWVQHETFQRAAITDPAHKNGQLLCSDPFHAARPWLQASVHLQNTVFARFTCLCVSLLDNNRLQSLKMQEFH